MIILISDWIMIILISDLIMIILITKRKKRLLSATFDISTDTFDISTNTFDLSIDQLPDKTIIQGFDIKTWSRS